MKHLRMRISQSLFYLCYLQISWHDISWKVTLRIMFDKWGHKVTSWMWSRDFSWVFLQCVQLLGRNVKIQAIYKVDIWTQYFWQKDSAKLTDQNLFSEKVKWSKVEKIIDQIHLSKSIPNVTWKFISYQWITLICFKFQNASIETWIRATKLS